MRRQTESHQSADRMFLSSSGGGMPPRTLSLSKHGDIVVGAVDPTQLVGIADNDALDSIAIEVTERFERVLSAVTDEEFESRRDKLERSG